MDHRYGLAVGGRLTPAGASAERGAAIVLAAGAISRARPWWPARRMTRDFVATLRALGVTPHATQHTTKRRRFPDTRSPPPALRGRSPSKFL